MTQLGLGVMINQMFRGNKETVESFQSSKGKTINKVELKDNELRFHFNDGTGLKMWDDGQSCCESRWMHTDDDLNHFEGTKLLDAELRDGGDVSKEEYKKVTNSENDYGPECCQSQFLEVKTDKGTFTVVNYVDHNGYYGGFDLIARTFKDE